MSHTDPPAAQPSILRERVVRSRLGVTRSWLGREVEEGRFPRPIKLSARAKGWLSTDIDDWLAERVAERDAAA